MITPLCGNGMSMAMHGGKIATALIHEFLQHRISRDHLETQYRRQWEQQFSSRLRTGRMIQSMFGKPMMTDLFIKAMKPFPKAVDMLIRQTHGDRY
jgi:flavin-dependent dehydrogenase